MRRSDAKRRPPAMLAAAPVATPDIDLCVAQDFERQDRALEARVAALLARLQDFASSGGCSTCGPEVLAKAQGRWLRLRASDCDAVHAIAAAGSGRNQARLGCLIEHTLARTRQLDTLYDEAL